MKNSHEYIDEKIDEYQKELIKIYKNALKDIKKDIDKKMSELNNNKDSSMREKRDKIKKLEKLYKKISIELNNCNIRAKELLENELSDSAKEVLKREKEDIINQIRRYGVNLNYTLYGDYTIKNILEDNIFTNLALENFTDKDRVYRELKLQFATGIIKGEGAQKIAKRIQSVINSNFNKAMLIARTEHTRVENQAKNEVFKGAVKEGISIKKKWISTRDSRVRKSHSFLNGEIVEMEEQFTNGLEYPGDPSGDPREVCNCRCTMRAIVEGVD